MIAKHPRSPYELDATLLLGQSLEAQGKLDAAAEQYRKMLAAAPSSRQPDGHYSLGLVLSKSAKYDEAAKELSAVVTDFPESKYAKPAKLQLGLVQLAAGKTAEARRTLTAAAKDSQDPASTNAARYGLAQVDIADRKFDSALATLDELLTTQPPPANLPQVALDHAVCQAELAHHEEAVKELAAWLRKNPDLPQAAEAQYRQAFSLHKLGKYDQSHAIAKPVGEGKSEFAQPAVELDAENLFLLAQYDAAAKVYSDLAVAHEGRGEEEPLHVSASASAPTSPAITPRRSSCSSRCRTTRRSRGTRRSGGRRSCWVTRSSSRASTPRPRTRCRSTPPPPRRPTARRRSSSSPWPSSAPTSRMPPGGTSRPSRPGRLIRPGPSGPISSWASSPTRPSRRSSTSPRRS